MAIASTFGGFPGARTTPGPCWRLLRRPAAGTSVSASAGSSAHPSCPGRRGLRGGESPPAEQTLVVLPVDPGVHLLLRPGGFLPWGFLQKVRCFSAHFLLFLFPQVFQIPGLLVGTHGAPPRCFMILPSLVISPVLGCMSVGPGVSMAISSSSTWLGEFQSNPGSRWVISPRDDCKIAWSFCLFGLLVFPLRLAARRDPEVSSTRRQPELAQVDLASRSCSMVSPDFFWK